MHHLINEIAKASGNEKQDLLYRYGDTDDFKKLLKYVYDPFIKFYMTAPITEGDNAGWVIDESSFDLLDDLANREITGHTALETVCDHIITLIPEHADLFKKIINKDLRMGVGLKTINKIFPGLIPGLKDGSEKPSIMLLKTFDPEKAKYPLVAAIKKDGVRARAVAYEMFTRAGHRFIGFDHIENELEKYNFEKDGEMMVPGIDFDGASGLIRNHQSVPNAVYWLFDIPGLDISKWARYLFMLRNIQVTNCIKIVPHYWIKNEAQLMAIYEGVLLAGEEGLVVYTNNHEYRDARSWDWTRLVPKKAADCQVIGFEEGKGRLAGSLGKIIVDFKGIAVKVGTGFTDAQRKNIWFNQIHNMGKIAECEYKEETKNGSMRQPRFKGFRYDKTEVEE